MQPANCSGAHYYFRENFYADNGVIPFLLVLEQLSRTGKSFSETMRPYMEGHYMSGELNYKVEDVQKIIDAVKNRFSKEGAEDFTDGYSLSTDDWRFNIRVIQHGTSAPLEYRSSQTRISRKDPRRDRTDHRI